jgi:hypothetical protein
MDGGCRRESGGSPEDLYEFKKTGQADHRGRAGSGMDAQRRGTTPPHIRVGEVTNSLRVESLSTSDFFSERRHALGLPSPPCEIRPALPCLHLSYPALRSGIPGTGLVLF